MLFTPRTPIDQASHLAGRDVEIGRVIEAVAQEGAHAIIYGERGVGKTSLAICIRDVLSAISTSSTSKGLNPIIVPRINCDGTDDYETVWRKVFAQIQFEIIDEPFGLNQSAGSRTVNAAEVINGLSVTPQIVLEHLRRFGQRATLVVILDEFDRLPTGVVTRHIADTIKGLSDNRVPATVVVVGVGDSISELVRGHESIGRHLIEVPVPRMSADDQKKIITDRLPSIELSIDDDALNIIPIFSRGLPFYVHLIGQKAAYLAIETSSPITRDCVAKSVTLALADSEHSMKQAYYVATTTAKRSRLPHTLAACALARTDEFGYFTPTAVCAPLARIMKRTVRIGEFNGRLKELATAKRGNVLQIRGEKYNRRYRFRDPLMEPYVVIKSLDDELITLDDIVAEQ